MKRSGARWRVALYRLLSTIERAAVPFVLGVIAALVFGVVYVADHVPNALLPIGMVQVHERQLLVEIADTPQSRARGEMFRDSVYLDGMWFQYPEARQAVFWMKNTSMPLDILFVGCDQRVLRIVRHAKPDDETPLSSGAPVCSVLELAAGNAAAFSIQLGTPLSLIPRR